MCAYEDPSDSIVKYEDVWMWPTLDIKTQSFGAVDVNNMVSNIQSGITATTKNM